MTAPLVLVVEDDADLRSLMQVLLEGSGLRVATASHGAEGLEAVAREMPAVVLLDMKMPVMDGWEFARRFRERHGRAAPVVVVTAAENAARTAREIEADAHLGKPFEIDDVLAIIESLTGFR